MEHFSHENFKMMLDTQEDEVKSNENVNQEASIPLSDYVNKLHPKAKKCDLKKYQKLESIHWWNQHNYLLHVFYPVLEASYNKNQQFKVLQSL